VSPPDAAELPTDDRIRGLLRRRLAVFYTHKLGLVGLVIVIFFVLFCFVGPLLYQTNQTEAALDQANLPPGTDGHPLGTTNVGYDVLGRLMVGGQASLLIGVGAALLATLVGSFWGAIAGYFGGGADSVMMRIVDAFLSIPMLFFLLFLSRLVTLNVPYLILGIALFTWLGPARLVRGETLTLRTREYVQAVRVMGGGGPRIVFRHILPNSVGTIMVNATFQVADAILALAALSFLGLSIPPPHAEWGGMLATGVQYVYDGYWWMIFPAGLAIILLVVAFNFIGDALRDSFDVRLQQG
jgi:peptide/nickel transport system permease protein